MCGRFSSTSQLQFLLEQFRAEPLGVEGHQPSWNVAPASDILVVTASADGARQLRALKWGLVPRWAKDPSGANRMINLRAETVREKKGWKSTLARKRCIIPIDGFYEWQDQGKGQRKQPFYITSRDFSPLALAGLWATWRDPSAAKDEDGGGGDELFTCTILTTSANDLMESVHHRMPVILAPEDWDAWLDPENTDTEELAKLLVPAPEEMLTLWPVDKAVGNVRNNRPELQEPLEGHQPITA
ncbi:MAG TPA: SOS response-associated peptidase [Actinomycetota bacterium]|jgi:putative SOS response-associated peptidase YedK|nr:SOS response-associated peptidase [Actinomycetota bacterium]